MELTPHFVWVTRRTDIFFLLTTQKSPHSEICSVCQKLQLNLRRRWAIRLNWLSALETFGVGACYIKWPFSYLLIGLIYNNVDYYYVHITLGLKNNFSASASVVAAWRKKKDGRISVKRLFHATPSRRPNTVSYTHLTLPTNREV